MVMFETTYRNTEVQLIETERDFVNALPELESRPRDVAIVDIMIPWVGRDEQSPLDSDVLERSAFRGGERVIEQMLAVPSLSYVPIIISSVFGATDLERQSPPHVVYAQKQRGDDYLAAMLRAMLVAIGKLPEQQSISIARRVWAAFEAAPGFAGFSVDLKKLIQRRDAGR